MRGFLVLLAGIWIITIALFVGANAIAPPAGADDWLFWLAIIVIWLLAVTFLIVGIQTYLPEHRPTPDGYVGRWRRPDGVVVHVARLGDGTLMVASDSQPPRDLGTVTGRDLASWVKLGTTPDGGLVER